MNNSAHLVSLEKLGTLASALSGRDLFVEHSDTDTWTNGSVIYLAPDASRSQQLKMLCVQSALLAANSLRPDIVKRLARRPELARRYLALEGHRALIMLDTVLPPLMQSVVDPALAACTDSPESSLQLAQNREFRIVLPPEFGQIRVREYLAAQRHAGGETSNAGQHSPRQHTQKPLTELEDDANQDDEDQEDFASSPVGGGGALGKLLQKMFQQVRRLKGGGSPGADTPTHWSRSGPRAGTHTLQSTARAESVEDAFGKSQGIVYPEWDIHRGCYRMDWCTVQEIDPPRDRHATVVWLEGHGLRKPLSRLGMGLDRFHRQPQGDDIDIDAAIEAQIEIMSGGTPDENFYIESQRHRRDLSVLILLDISGSVAQTSLSGPTVDEQQRRVAAALTTVLHEVGDRVAMYAFHSQGRSAVHIVPVKRFDENLDSLTMSRLHSLIPGAYSRLGAAIRHGVTLLIEKSGTPRRMLVVLSDGLAYDHGYEPAYGAADARQALAEARRDGVGCLCLSVGAATDSGVLRRVFGSAAHATVPKPNQLGQIIGPLFRSALRAAEVQRRVA